MNVKSQTIEAIAKLLRGNPILKRIVYDPLKVFLRRRLCSLDYMLYYMGANKECKEDFPSCFESSCLGKKVGIIIDPFHSHEPYMAACKDLNVGYMLVDLFASDWKEQIQSSGCDTFLVWPMEAIQEWKRLYDDRLRILVEVLGKKIFPDLQAVWLYGSKERQSEWLELNGFAHPRTKVFYRKDEALLFLDEVSRFPIVAKTDIGAVASGVVILRSKKETVKYVKRAFSVGIQGYYSDKQARQWRHVLFQEYLPNVKEWRVHRQNNSFFGFGKAKKGDFHSGSGGTHWIPPPKAALDLAWEITEKGGFGSMAVDIFETDDGRFLVNELQCVYGQHCPVQLVKDGKSGRFLRDTNGDWVFEEGVFSVNHGCNLRLEAALRL